MVAAISEAAAPGLALGAGGVTVSMQTDPIAIQIHMTLTDMERNEFAQCEAVVERGLHTFVEVGNALLAIRDKRLYREEYGTFEEYCQERWALTRRYINMTINAAQVISNLGTIVPKLPKNEYQARPLTQLQSPEEQREAWRRAVETASDGKVTGAHVQRVVDAIRQEKAISSDKAKGKNLNVHFSSKTVECYTPPEIIERVIRVMGAIDLDPCSNSKTAPNVPAGHHLTTEDDGLAHPWFGRVYMNPPYGQEIADWVEYLCEQYEAGNVEEAIALVPSRTDTQWFRRLRQYPRCFIWGRLRFGGQGNSAPFPSMVVYLGENLTAFIEAFRDIGDTYAIIIIPDE